MTVYLIHVHIDRQRRGEERRGEGSRGEQSRAEQSRAEQNRAEHNRTEKSTIQQVKQNRAHYSTIKELITSNIKRDFHGQSGAIITRFTNIYSSIFIFSALDPKTSAREHIKAVTDLNWHSGLTPCVTRYRKAMRRTLKVSTFSNIHRDVESMRSHFGGKVLITWRIREHDAVIREVNKDTMLEERNYNEWISTKWFAS